MNETYLYPYSAKEARERNELSLWRESHRANIACREAIEDAIRRSFDGMHLDKDCITPVLDEYDKLRNLRKKGANISTSSGFTPQSVNRRCFFRYTSNVEKTTLSRHICFHYTAPVSASARLSQQRVKRSRLSMTFGDLSTGTPIKVVFKHKVFTVAKVKSVIPTIRKKKVVTHYHVFCLMLTVFRPHLYNPFRNSGGIKGVVFNQYPTYRSYHSNQLTFDVTVVD